MDKPEELPESTDSFFAFGEKAGNDLGFLKSFYSLTRADCFPHV